jgi:hypothetical protein
MPRSKVGDDFPAPTPPSAPAIRLIKICSMLLSVLQSDRIYAALNWESSLPRCPGFDAVGSYQKKTPALAGAFVVS